MVELKNIPDISINSRLQVNHYYGTVKYVGEVKEQKGVWVGVEWDDVTRGKHNGFVQDVQYFSTNHPTSGSLIRIEKVPKFETLEESIKTRYLVNIGDTIIDQKLLNELKKHSHAAIFEVVGMEKIANKQRHLDKLEDISVAHCNVNSPGNLSQLKNLTMLDISSTLVWNWNIVADITREIPTLKSLSLANNRLLLPTQYEIAELEPCFRHIKYINLRNCDIKRWENVLLIAQLWLNIEYITLQENNIETIPANDYANIFSKLENLDLQKNKLSNFKDILNLGSIPNLNILNVMNNNIELVELPECGHDDKLDFFKNLNTLFLAENPIKNEVSTFNELDKLPCLKGIVHSPQPDLGYEKMFVNAAALIRTLEVVNKTNIEKKDKRYAEYDIWKQFGEEWLANEKNPENRLIFLKKCRVYSSLIEKYGSPAEFICNANAVKPNIITINIINELTEQIIPKKLPLRMSIQILFNLIQKLFHIDYNDMESQRIKIYYIDKNQCKIQLDNVRRNLDFYSVEDNDTILIAKEEK